MILNVLGSLVVCIAGVVLLMWIAQAILVDRHLRNQRAISCILAKLSLQQGVSKDEMDKILNQNKDK